MRDFDVQFAANKKVSYCSTIAVMIILQFAFSILIRATTAKESSL